MEIIFDIIAIIFSLKLAARYVKTRDSSCLPISFKQFSDLYKINNQRWSFSGHDTVFYYKNYTREEFYFQNFFDWIKFQKFLSDRKKMKFNEEKQRRMLKIVKCWQEDISSYQENYLEELKKEQAKIETSIKKLKGL